ncbi:MAG: DMT family transporter [Clostridiales bacterium]|nr:DMT family transporter [Clostridiales bacterium]
MSEKKKINPKTMGIIFIIISAFSFACMALFVNMSGEMPVFQKAFFRNCVAIILSLGLLIRSKDKFKVKKGSLKYLLLRASFGTLGILFNFYAISHINLADAQILNKLSPFFAILASIFILKEVANRRQWICIIVAFIGALFVVKPTGLSNPDHLFPALIGLAGGLVAGIAYTFMRKLSLHGERSEVIVAFFSIFSCVVLIPFVIFTYEPITLKQLLCLLLAGTCACSGQIFITSAYARCPAKEISIYDYSSVIFAAILGFIFLGQKPDIYSFIGYLIIIGASVYSYIHNVRKQPSVA